MAARLTQAGEEYFMQLAIDPREPTLVGYRGEARAHVYLFHKGRHKEIRYRNDLRNHSPTGPEWGYGGSGPAQLALALACQVLPDKQALAVYQQLKAQYIAKLKEDGWRWPVKALRESVLAIMATVKVPPLCNCDGRDYCPICDGGMGE